MADRWFRFYESVIDDPKVQRLPDHGFRAWVNLMCLASKHGGMFSTDLADIAFALRVTESKARDLIQLLQSAELIERFEASWQPHNWKKRQYKSDVSTERVKRFRNRFSNDDETVTETAPETDTESESDTEAEKKSAPVARRNSDPKPLPDWVPEKAWLSFVEMRKKIRAPLTLDAAVLAMGVLEKLRASGQDPGAVLEQSVMRSWRGLFPIAEENQRKTARESSLQQAHRIANELANADACNEISDHGADHGAGNALPQIGHDRRRA